MTPPTSSSSHLERRLRLKRPYGGESPYAESNTDHDAASETSSGDAAYFCSPVTPTSGHAGASWGIHARSYLPNGPSHSLSNAMNHHQHQNINSHSANAGINISGMGMGMGDHGLGHNKGLHYGHTHNHKLMNPHMSVNGAMVVGHNGTNPWLSAIPRSIGGLADMTASWRAKRRAEELDGNISDERDRERERDIHRSHPTDEEYDGEESASATGDEKSPIADDRTITFGPRAHVTNMTRNHQYNTMAREEISGDKITNAAGDEKKAAWLLMKLSVKDGEAGAALPSLPSVSAVGTPLMGSAKWIKDEGDSDGPRVKRRRALSM